MIPALLGTSQLNYVCVVVRKKERKVQVKGMRRQEGARASSDVELAEETMDKRGVCDRPGCFQGPCAAVSSFFLGLAKYARRGGW